MRRYASRAIDTLLALMVNRERAKGGRAPKHFEIGPSLQYVHRYGIGGQHFNAPTEAALHLLRQDRNAFLHTANLFPSNPQLLAFLTTTIRAISEATTFPS
jgi:hypothetical protein